MTAEPVLLDTDTLSELSRANPVVSARARAYLIDFGRLTISSVTVFERLRGYRQVIRAGRPFDRQMQAFATLVKNSVVLPFDEDAADVAASIWANCTRAQRRKPGDILIAAIAVSRQIPLVTRNKRDFEALGRTSGTHLRSMDWATPIRRSST